MDLIFSVELFDEIDELELIEFGIPRNMIVRQDYYNSLLDYKFVKKFRLTKETLMFVLPQVEDQLEFPLDMNNSVPPIIQILTCLRYFATGGHIDAVADYMGMDPTTAGRIIHRVSRAIASLYRRFIKLPTTQATKTTTKSDFYSIARFPNVVGAIDCTHIKVLSPGGDAAEIFRNRKGFFSINVQAVCDANCNFIDVVARWPGSSHDSIIFNNSNIKSIFEANRMPQCVLLGDKGYELKNYFLTPLLNPITEAERLYNESYIRTRNKIECTFGILKRRFPVLAYGCRLKLENIQPVMIAAAVLHNITRMRNEAQPGVDIEDMNAQELDQLILNGQIQPIPAAEPVNRHNTYRSLLIKTYFVHL